MLDITDTRCVRCKACDKPFSPTWYEERKAWEDLCYDCLAKALDIYPDDEDYVIHIDNLYREIYDE